MLKVLFISIGLVLVIEGLLYFFLANKLDLISSIIKNLNPIFEKNFVLSGLNLAFLGYYFNNEVKIYQNLYHWPDGIFAKTVFDNIDKVPGREIVNNMKPTILCIMDGWGVGPNTKYNATECPRRNKI